MAGGGGGSGCSWAWSRQDRRSQWVDWEGIVRWAPWLTADTRRMALRKRMNRPSSLKLSEMWQKRSANKEISPYKLLVILYTCKKTHTWSQCGCSRKSIAAKQLVSGWIGSESPLLLLSELQPIAWCTAPMVQRNAMMQRLCSTKQCSIQTDLR